MRTGGREKKKDNGRFKLSKLRIIALSRRFVISSIVFFPPDARERNGERKKGRKEERDKEREYMNEEV